MQWKRRNTVFTVLLACCMTSVLNAQPMRNIRMPALQEIKLWSASEKTGKTLGNSNGLRLLVLLSPECPMSVNYTLTLNTLVEKFRNQLDITGIIPGNTFSDDAILQFAAAYKLKFPLLADKELSLVKMIAGEVTPEAFLFDQGGELVYSGAIDNWLTELGKKKQKPDKLFLQDAIQSTLGGVPVAVKYIKAQGCLVNDY